MGVFYIIAIAVYIRRLILMSQIDNSESVVHTQNATGRAAGFYFADHGDTILTGAVPYFVLVYAGDDRGCAVLADNLCKGLMRILGEIFSREWRVRWDLMKWR